MKMLIDSGSTLYKEGGHGHAAQHAALLWQLLVMLLLLLLLMAFPLPA